MMSEQFLQQIFSFIKEHELIRAGDTVFAGVSGGADSMCLLEALGAYQSKLDFDLRVIHVEHGIRGEESLADADYVSAFCEERRIPCQIVAVDAPAYSVAHACSVEEAARELRYEAFETAARTAENRGCAKKADPGDMTGAKSDHDRHVRIAVAHHMEDQAETMLWQLIRGSDIKGMGAMRPVRGRIIRPLLGSTRAQIEDFLRERDIRWREDATNSDGTYTRNRLRMDVLPVLTQLNEQAVAHLCESAGRLQETESYLVQQTEALYQRCVVKTERGGWCVKASILKEVPLLQRRVLYRVLQNASTRARDLTSKHVGLLQELFSHQTGRKLMLPYGVLAIRTYDGVELFPDEVSDVIRDIQIPPEKLFQMEILDRFDCAEISKKKYTKWFDYDKIKYNVQIRGRQSGDFLVVDDAGHRQKLKNYLVNEKIPQAEREKLMLLADGSHIMWVVGHRISNYYKVDEHTKRVLKVQYHGGKQDE